MGFEHVACEFCSMIGAFVLTSIDKGSLIITCRCGHTIDYKSGKKLAENMPELIERDKRHD